LRFAASAEVTEDSVVHVLTIRNTSATARDVGTSCENAGGVLVVTDGTGGEAGWSEYEFLRRRGCFPLIDVNEIPARDSLELRRAVATADVLGDSLAPATYHLFMETRFIETGSVGRVPVWKIPLGRHYLSAGQQ